MQEVEVLRQQVANYEKDKMTLQLTKQRLLHSDKQFKNLEWEKEVLSQRFAKVEKERDDLYHRFESAVLELQQKSGLKGILLERKLEAAHEVIEKKESMLAEVLAASHLDGPTLQNVRHRFSFCFLSAFFVFSPAEMQPHALTHVLNLAACCRSHAFNVVPPTSAC
jgi:growth arrest-specific protein 8